MSERAAFDPRVAIKMCDQMANRGPDGHGSWNAPAHSVALAHRRLAIIDLTDAGAQPMHDEQRGLSIVFNGEIYNYRELRSGLEARGYRFRTQSDTEVLLAAYAIYGTGMMPLLRGMFAFAIWDSKAGQLFLARDPLGIKPLYYSARNGVFMFASQVRALQAAGAGVSPSAAGHVGFFLFGHVPEPFTLYEDIKSLPSGSTMLVTQSGPQASVPYWRLTDILAAAFDRPQMGDRKERLANALKSSVEYHLVSDVPVGVFLSAGRDSASLLALADELGHRDLHTFTLGFSEFVGTPDDETALAAQVAKQFRSQHTTSWVERSDFLNSLDHLLSSMDQPSIDGVNVYMVSREARRMGLKVALNGVGADELFGGYPSFYQIPRLVGALGRIPFAQATGRAFRRLSSPALERISSPKFAGVLEYGVSYEGAYLLRRSLFMPWEIEDILGPELTNGGLEELDVMSRLQGSIAGVKSEYARILALEVHWYMRDRLLRDADWASMAHSLEIRVPYVDHKLVEELAGDLCGPHPFTKSEMATVPTAHLPAAILDRPKTGFSVPVRDWIIQGLDLTSAKERGLRAWAKHIYKHATSA